MYANGANTDSYTLEPYMYILFVYHIHCTRIFAIRTHIQLQLETMRSTFISRRHFDKFSSRCYRKIRVSINVRRSFPLVCLVTLNLAKFMSISSSNMVPMPLSLSLSFLFSFSFFLSPFNQLSLLIAFYWSRLLCVSHPILLSSLHI